MAVLQEPYVGGAGYMRSYPGVRIFQGAGEGIVKAAIAVFDPTLDIIQHPELTTNNIVVVEVRTSAWKIALISLYFEPLQPIEPYLEHLREIVGILGSSKLIIGGDANAKSMWWGSTRTDHRGEDMAGTLHELGLHVLNTGDIPTFDVIRNGKSCTNRVDLTACSTDMLDLLEKWEVVENLTSSDHNGITFNIKMQRAKGMHVERTTRIYNTKKANWNKFRDKLQELRTKFKIRNSDISQINGKDQIETSINNYTKAITGACRHAIPKKKKREILTLPWWSDELATMKKEVATKKRRIRCAAPIRKAMVVKEYLVEKERYETEAMRAQTRSWKEFCTRQDKEGVWEGIYRVLGRTSNRQEDLLLQREGKVLDAKESAMWLVETFYPQDLQENDNVYHCQIRQEAASVNGENIAGTCDPPFTKTELDIASKSFNPKKAPGADSFTADVCLNAIESDPEMFLGLINKCLEYHCFPKKMERGSCGNTKEARERLLHHP